MAEGERRAPTERRDSEYRLVRSYHDCGRVLCVRRLHGHSRRDCRRQLPLGRRRDLPHRHDRHDSDVARLQQARGNYPGRVARASSARDVRNDDTRGRARSHHRVPRHRADVDRDLRAGGNQSAQRAVRRGSDQVLPARRVFHGVSPVRNRARLRRDRRDQLYEDRGEHRQVPPRDQSAAPCRSRASPRRLRLQGRCRTVSHVGARRLRRSADANHRLHGGRGQGRCVRGILQALARGVPPRSSWSGISPCGGWLPSP